jgi:hypothetical protein
MRLFPVLGAAAMALGIGSTHASAVEFKGSTTGCFGAPCTAHSTATDHTLKFTGSSPFDVSLTAPATSVAVNLGSFTLTNSGLFNPYIFNGDSFDLKVNFTSPALTTANIFADVTGFITVLGGLVYVDFSPQTVTYSGGSFLLSVHDVLLGTTLFDRRDVDLLTGTITMSSAVPEPSTWAMMMLGFAGLGFLTYRRRRQSRDTLASA